MVTAGDIIVGYCRLRGGQGDEGRTSEGIESWWCWIRGQ